MDGLFLSAEYLVASELSKIGYPVSTAASGLEYDLVVDIGNRLFKVQVKSTVTLRSHGPKSQAQRYIFNITKGSRLPYHLNSFDIIAFVALDTSLVGYMSAGQVIGCSKVTLRGPEDPIGKGHAIHELPFMYALEKALVEKSFSLDQALTSAFGKK